MISYCPLCVSDVAFYCPLLFVVLICHMMIVCNVCSPAGDKIPGDGVSSTHILKDLRMPIPALGKYQLQPFLIADCINSDVFQPFICVLLDNFLNPHSSYVYHSTIISLVHSPVRSIH